MDKIDIIVIGHNDKISFRLLKCLDVGYKAFLLTPKQIISEQGKDYLGYCDLVLVNLIAISASNEKILLPLLKEKGTPTIGIHVYNVPLMIKSILDKGYSNYLCLFEFNNNINHMLNNTIMQENRL